MKIAIVTPGGVDRSGSDRVIPCLLWLIETGEDCLLDAAAGHKPIFAEEIATSVNFDPHGVFPSTQNGVTGKTPAQKSRGAVDCGNSDVRHRPLLYYGLDHITPSPLKQGGLRGFGKRCILILS